MDKHSNTELEEKLVLKEQIVDQSVDEEASLRKLIRSQLDSSSVDQANTPDAEPAPAVHGTALPDSSQTELANPLSSPPDSANKLEPAADGIVDTCFEPNRAVVEAAMVKLQESERSILAFGTVGMAAFSIVFGNLAAVTFLFWVCACILLTKFNYLGSKYELKLGVDDTKLTFKRKDAFGRSTLALGWDMLKSIEEHDIKDARELSITIKPMKLAMLKRWAFQDLFHYGPIIDRIIIGSGDFKNRDSYNSFVDEIKNASVSKKVAASFLSNLDMPVEVEPEEAPDLNQNGSSSVDELEQLVPYNPDRISQELRTKLLRSFEIPIFLALMAIPLLLFLLSGLYSAKFAGLLIIGVSAWFCLNPFLNEKANFLFNKDGISLLWQNAFSIAKNAPTMSKSPCIPWHCVRRVFVRQEKRSKSSPKQKQTIVLMLNPKEKRQLKHLHVLRCFAPKLISIKNGSIELCLNVDGLVSEKTRQSLYSALCQNLPEECIDASVRELLNPTDLASYTKLWMDSFNEASSRRFEGALPEGQQLRNGEYEVESFLGAGGQASVYLAKSKSASFAQKVVLKEFILPAHAGADVSQRSLANIQREFDLMKRLGHKNIVQYHDIFVEDHRAYLVLEHVDGPSLRAMVDERGSLPESEIWALADSMAHILDHLHSQSPAIIHRDFTPENLILGKDGVLKLIDFNVAQELETEATRTIVGKHSYLPPEQFRGKATAQSDIYAFGASLFFMLTGTEPEPISCSHPILLDDSINEAMDELVSKSTRLELEERYLSARDLIDAINSMVPKADDTDTDTL